MITGSGAQSVPKIGILEKDNPSLAHEKLTGILSLKINGLTEFTLEAIG